MTGANSALGIGRAACHLFAASGAAALYICDYDDTNLATHQREINALYPACAVTTKRFDATDEAQVRGVCDEAVATHGRLDVFFANAGVASTQPLHDLEADDFMRMLRVNLLSVFLCAKHASRAMMATAKGKVYPGGSIVATASTAGLRSNAGPADYSASKAGVISLAQTCAYQLAGTGVRMNAICPGIIETGMTQAMYEMARAKGSEKKIGQLNPLRRGGVADEVARVSRVTETTIREVGRLTRCRLLYSWVRTRHRMSMDRPGLWMVVCQRGIRLCRERWRDVDKTWPLNAWMAASHETTKPLYISNAHRHRHVCHDRCEARLPSIFPIQLDGK